MISPIIHYHLVYLLLHNKLNNPDIHFLIAKIMHNVFHMGSYWEVFFSIILMVTSKGLLVVIW